MLMKVLTIGGRALPSMMQLAELIDYDGQLELPGFFQKSLIKGIRIIEAL